MENENPIEKKENIKKKVIATLEELEAVIDEVAKYSAQMDEPNAGWDYLRAKERKAVIDSFIEKMKDL